MTLNREPASPEAMIAYGRDLAATLPPSALIILSGELGAGKTTLVKGLVAGLGLGSEDDVTSPSYTLMHEYHGGNRSLFHLDLYRIDTEAQTATLGLEDLWSDLATGGAARVVVVEWGEKIRAQLPLPYLNIQIAISRAGREIRAAWVGI